MNKIVRIKAIILAFVILTLFAVVSVYAVTESDLEQNQNEQQQLQDEQKKLEEEMLKNQQQQEEQNKKLLELETSIANTERKIDVLTGKITDYNKQIKQKSGEVIALEKSIKKSYERLKNRLRVIYIAGDASNIEILLGAKDFDDFLDKSYLIENIAQQDAELISGISKKIEDINLQQEEIEKAKASEEESQKELEAEITALGKTQDECNKLIEKLQIDQTDIENDIADNEAEMELLVEQFSQMQKEAAGGGMYNYGEGSTVLTSGKKYILPAPECTIVTAYWGDERNHKGIDFACNGSAYGKPIVSVAEGTVTVANSTDDWGYGWGYYIMIDHGDGYYTQYAHCSRVVVEVGQTVKQGEIIGYIGNTGNSFGPHLHFECWYNGERYDPATELFG